MKVILQNINALNYLGFNYIEFTVHYTTIPTTDIFK